jgi:hypothetical protein
VGELGSKGENIKVEAVYVDEMYIREIAPKIRHEPSETGLDAGKKKLI